MSRRPVDQHRKLSITLLAKGALILSAILLFASVFLLCRSGIWIGSAITPEQDSPENNFIILMDQSFSSARPHLLEAALRADGYTVDIQFVGSIKAVNGQPWLIAVGMDAQAVLDAAGRMGSFKGLFLLAPDNLADAADAYHASWPAISSLVILTGQANEQGSEARMFFQQVTGEDASLYPDDQRNALGPKQVATADGQVWLMIYPGMVSDLVLASPSILPDLVGMVSDWTDAKPAVSDVPESLANLMVDLAAAGLLLLAIPLGLQLVLPEKTPQSERTGFRMTILWLLAALPAGAAGLALARLSGAQQTWLILSILMLPGFRGYLSWLNRLLDNQADKPVRPTQGLWQITGLVVTMLAGLSLIALFVLLFGWPANTVWTWVVLVVLAAVSWPSGYADQQTSGHPVVTVVLRHLPFFLLILWAVIRQGTFGLVAAMILLGVRFLAAGLGGALTRFSGSMLIGSIFEGTIWTAVLLVWPVLGLLA